MALRRPEPRPSRGWNASPWPESLAGAAATLTDDMKSWKTYKLGNADWQKDAWRLYDITPEFRFLAAWIGGSLAAARLHVVQTGEGGENLGEVDDPAIARLANIPLGTDQTREDMLRLAGIDLAVAGECWIVGEGAAKDPAGSTGGWFVVTGALLKRTGDDVFVRRPKTHGGGTLRLTDGVDVLIRCWSPHPNDPDQADSPGRPSIVPLREIELITQSGFAALDSRLTGAGVWFLPEGIDFPRGPDDPEGAAGFVDILQRAMTTSVRNRGDARSVVPIVATVPDHMVEHVDKLKPINFWTPLAEMSPEMKRDCIVRLASAFEIPNEILLGMSNVNHWTAWAVSEEGIKRVSPYLSTVAGALTRGFLRPTLTSLGYDDIERYAYAFDTAPLAARPNRLEDALKLRELFLLSDEDVVRAGAFDVEQMPNGIERVQQILVRLVIQNPALLSDPGIREALGITGVTGATVSAPSSPALPVGEEPDGSGAPGSPPAGGDPGNGPSSGDPPTSHRALVRIDRMMPALELAMMRAMELAGGRLTKPQERRGVYAGVPRHDLPARVGPLSTTVAERVLAGSWVGSVDVVARPLGVDPADLTRILHDHAVHLLTTGTRHDPVTLRSAVERGLAGVDGTGGVMS